MSSKVLPSHSAWIVCFLEKWCVWPLLVEQLVPDHIAKIGERGSLGSLDAASSSKGGGGCCALWWFHHIREPCALAPVSNVLSRNVLPACTHSCSEF